MKAVHFIAWILIIIGGLNWLLVGLGVGNVVEMVLGMGALTKIVYVLVGVGAIYEIVTHKKNCKCCTASGAPSQTM